MPKTQSGKTPLSLLSIFFGRHVLIAEKRTSRASVAGKGGHAARTSGAGVLPAGLASTIVPVVRPCRPGFGTLENSFSAKIFIIIEHLKQDDASISYLSVNDPIEV